MSSWQSHITQMGANLFTESMGGAGITFTKVQFSQEEYPPSTDFETLTSLSDVVQEAPVNLVSYSAGVLSVGAVKDNTDVAEPYYLHTVGLFANTGGADALVAILVATNPDYVPAFLAGSLTSVRLKFEIAIGPGLNVNITVSPAAFASASDVVVLFDRVSIAEDKVVVLFDRVSVAEDKVEQLQHFTGSGKGPHTWGVRMNFQTGECVRLGDAVGKIGHLASMGPSADYWGQFAPWARKRVWITEDGIEMLDPPLTESYQLSENCYGCATYDAGSYTEGASQGARMNWMVRQPLFYFKCIPWGVVMNDPVVQMATNSHNQNFLYPKCEGVDLYVSDAPQPGFAPHPLFMRRTHRDEPLQCVYLSATQCVGRKFNGIEDIMLYSPDVPAPWGVHNIEQFASVDGSVGPYSSALGAKTNTTQLPNDDGVVAIFKENHSTGWEPWGAEALSLTWMLFVVEHATLDQFSILNTATPGNTHCGETKDFGNYTGRTTWLSSYRGEEALFGDIGNRVVGALYDTGYDLMEDQLNGRFILNNCVDSLEWPDWPKNRYSCLRAADSPSANLSYGRFTTQHMLAHAVVNGHFIPVPDQFVYAAEGHNASMRVRPSTDDADVLIAGGHHSTCSQPNMLSWMCDVSTGSSLNGTGRALRMVYRPHRYA